MSPAAHEGTCIDCLCKNDTSIEVMEEPVIETPLRLSEESSVIIADDPQGPEVTPRKSQVKKPAVKKKPVRR